MRTKANDQGPLGHLNHPQFVRDIPILLYAYPIYVKDRPHTMTLWYDGRSQCVPQSIRDFMAQYFQDHFGNFHHQYAQNAHRADPLFLNMLHLFIPLQAMKKKKKRHHSRYGYFNFLAYAYCQFYESRKHPSATILNIHGKECIVYHPLPRLLTRIRRANDMYFLHVEEQIQSLAMALHTKQYLLTTKQQEVLKEILLLLVEDL